MTRTTSEDAAIINRGSLSSVWKTESGYATLGIFANIAIVLAVTLSVYLSGGSPTIGSKVFSGTCAASFIVAGLYLLTIYRSYYSSKPIVRSCKIASFLNGFLGAGLFGLLWNRLLTKSKSGDSAGVLGAIALLLWAAYIVFNIYTITNYQPKPIPARPIQGSTAMEAIYVWISYMMATRTPTTLPEPHLTSPAVGLKMSEAEVSYSPASTIPPRYGF